MAGRIEPYVHSDGSTPNKAAALVRVSCQTDFAAKTLEFRQFCAKVAQLACGLKTTEWNQLAVHFPGIVQDLGALEGKLKEKITVDEIVFMELN